MSSPKPFEYIPFAKRPERSAPAGHHRFATELVTGHMTGEIHVLTPLHVASGGIELTQHVARDWARNAPLIKSFVRSRGVRIIPGSSLKGAVRSVVEAITPSTVGKVGYRTRVPSPLQEPRQLNRDRSSSRPLKPPAENELSPADRLFGVMDYLGQVSFTDAAQIGDEVELVRMPSLFAPRGRGPARGRKFYKHGRPATGSTPVEAVPAGGRFGLRCDFENLSPAEVGVLLIALGLGEPRLHLKLGGGKPACYGSVRIELGGLHLRDDIRQEYLSWEGSQQSAEPAPYVEAALADAQLLLRPQLEALAQTLRYPNDRDCPEGNY